MAPWKLWAVYAACVHRNHQPQGVGSLHSWNLGRAVLPDFACNIRRNVNVPMRLATYMAPLHMHQMRTGRHDVGVSQGSCVCTLQPTRPTDLAWQAGYGCMDVRCWWQQPQRVRKRGLGYPMVARKGRAQADVQPVQVRRGKVEGAPAHGLLGPLVHIALRRATAQ